MTELVHDAEGERIYETGVSKAVLFPHTGGAYVWNGITGVTFTPIGGDSEKFYYDGAMYFERVKAEEFSATIDCVNTPKAFEQCEGIYSPMAGMYTHFNQRIKFNLAWVTKIANDLDENLGYYLHLAYNCQAQPASKSYSTVTDIQTPDARSIPVTTTPACGIYSYYKFDSREADVDALLSSILGGTLPPCNELSVGPPPPPTEENECIHLITDLNGYNPGQTLDEDIENAEEDSQVIIFGEINNGFDIYEFPANGDYAENSSPAIPTVVGAGDVLADADDATYIESGEGDLGYTVALPVMTGGYSVGSRFELHIRMSISGGINPDDPENIDAEAQVHISTDPEGLETIGGFSDGAQEGMAFKLTDVTGEIVDYVIPLRMDTWINSDIEDVVDALKAGAYLNFLAAENFNPDSTLLPVEVKIYDAKVVLINNTDGDRYLRTLKPGDDGWLKQYVWNAAGTAYYPNAFTTFVDFKIKSIGLDVAKDGAVKKILSFDGNDPGSLTAEFHLETDNPYIAWRDGTATGDPTVGALIEYDTWYRVRTYWSGTEFNVKVWAYEEDGAEYLIDRNVVADNAPTVHVEHYAGKVGNENLTYEVVYDNARLLVNCFELAPTTIDLPAWHVNQQGGTTDSAALSTTDTGTYLTWNPLGRMGANYFAETDHGLDPAGNPNVYLPETPDGYVLTAAKYVVIARSNLIAGPPYTGSWEVLPPPTTVPYLYCESPLIAEGVDHYTMDNIPVGSFGELVCDVSESLSNLTSFNPARSANRLWVDGWDADLPGETGAVVDVAYFAIRLYYDPV